MNLGAFIWTPQVTTLTTWPNRCSRIAGSSPIVSRTGPRKLIAMRALEVVEPALAERERAPDRAAGVVDQVVDRAVLGEHPRDQRVDGVDVGQVAGVRRRAAAAASIAARTRSSSSARRATSSTVAPPGDRQRGGLADPGGGAGDEHGRPASGLGRAGGRSAGAAGHAASGAGGPGQSVSHRNSLAATSVTTSAKPRG